jgi:hypothetical protein
MTLGSHCVHRGPPLPCPECAYTRGVADERGRVVAWLRDIDWGGATTRYAAMIEAGEHESGGGDGG